MRIYRKCREELINAVNKVFGNDENFLDFIENGEYQALFYNCGSLDDEFYIINRASGEYINWYKFTHIGRDIHSTVDPNNFEVFLQKFYESRF